VKAAAFASRKRRLLHLEVPLFAIGENRVA